MKKPFSLKNNLGKDKKQYKPEELTLIEYQEEEEPSVSDLVKDYLKKLDD